MFHTFKTNDHGFYSRSSLADKRKVFALATRAGRFRGPPNNGYRGHYLEGYC